MKKPEQAASPRKTGEYYELYTESLLRKKGYSPIRHSYINPPYEIDLIMMDGTTFVFIEVKERLDTDPVAPEYHADREKMNNVFLAACAFIGELAAAGIDIAAFGYRFDLAAIVRDREHNVTDFRYYTDYYEAEQDEILRFALRYGRGSV